MSDIILVLYYESSLGSVKMLNKLIEKIEGENKKFIISSHSTVSNDVIKRSSGYLYDPFNPLCEVETEIFFYKQLGEWILTSPYLFYGSLSHRSHALASFTNCLNGINLAKQLGYDIVHCVEYDCLPDFDDLNKNSEILSNGFYRGVVYKNKDTTILGSIFSLSVNYFSNMNPRVDDIRLHLSKHKDFSEVAFYEYIRNCIGEDFIFEKNRSLQPLHYLNDLGSVTIESVIVEYDKSLFLFLITENLQNILNVKFYSNLTHGIFEMDQYSWKMFELGIRSEVNFVDIYVNDSLYRAWDIRSQENYQKHVGRNFLEKNAQ